jgi:c-di-GMP-binding flagellar brake protein YcgR
MSEIMTIRADQPRKVLQLAVGLKIPAIMSYLSKGKWHAAKVQMVRLADEHLSVESVDSLNRRRPVNIQINQPVGISFKHEFGKYVFETTVLAFEQPPNGQCDGVSAIVVAVPQQMQIVQRRSYFRVEVPSSLKVRVLLWPRSPAHKINGDIYERNRPLLKCCHGRLLDISAGGIQIVLPLQQTEETLAAEQTEPFSDDMCQAETVKPNFKKGQFVGIRFTPLPYETPMTLSAQIRNILPTADEKGLSVGMQIVGLEASAEGHQLLTRLITVVGRYYQMNESGTRQKEKAVIPCVR